MPIYKQLHQTITLFLLRILYMDTFSIYIYMENIIIPILFASILTETNIVSQPSPIYASRDHNPSFQTLKVIFF